MIPPPLASHRSAPRARPGIGAGTALRRRPGAECARAGPRRRRSQPPPRQAPAPRRDRQPRPRPRLRGRPMPKLSSSAIRNSMRSAPTSAVSAENQAKLRREIETIGEDRRTLNQQLIDTAARVRDVEASIDATRRAAQAARRAGDRSAQIARRTPQRRSSKFSAALQRVGHQPPPALLVRPEDALKAVRTAITLGAVLPDMRSPGRCDCRRPRRPPRRAQGHRRRDASISRTIAIVLGHEQLRMKC